MESSARLEVQRAAHKTLTRHPFPSRRKAIQTHKLVARLTQKRAKGKNGASADGDAGSQSSPLEVSSGGSPDRQRRTKAGAPSSSPVRVPSKPKPKGAFPSVVLGASALQPGAVKPKTPREMSPVENDGPHAAAPSESCDTSRDVASTGTALEALGSRLKPQRQSASPAIIELGLPV